MLLFLRRVDLRIKSTAILLFLVLLTFSCSNIQTDEVVIYTSVDEHYSRVILKDFELKTGIKVKPIFDVEATKSAGLANRLIAEKDNSRADVFWSGEPMHTLILKQKGVLEKYKSPSSSDIPEQFRDKENFWTAFSGRIRVIIYNKDKTNPEEIPSSLFDLTKPKFRGKFAIANPLFGSTTFHFVSLFEVLGEEKAKDFIAELKNNDVRIVDGNSMVRKLVERGEIEMGLTDNDDADLSLESGMNVGIIYPDTDSIGTPFMPNMVALIKGGPNPENGKRLLDYLLSRDVEEKLKTTKWSKFSVREITADNLFMKEGTEIRFMNMDLEKVATWKEEALKEIKRILNL